MLEPEQSEESKVFLRLEKQLKEALLVGQINNIN